MNMKKKPSAVKSRSGRTQSDRPEDERLPIGSTFAYGLQHVLTMYGGIIAPPLIIGAAAGMPSEEIGLLIAACLFVGGLATILQTIGIPFFGSRLPLVQGVSFAGVSTMVAIVDEGGGIQSVFGSVIAAKCPVFLATIASRRSVVTSRSARPDTTAKRSTCPHNCLTR